MSNPDRMNRQGVLNARPKGEPDADTLRWMETPPPMPGEGKMPTKGGGFTS